MTAQEILAEIKPLGRDSYRNVLFNHGIPEPCYGVKIEELKKIHKRIKTDYQLALDLYDTGVYDAMYLAGLIAEDAKMTKKDLQHWVEKACAPLTGSTVTWVTAGSPHALEMALEWIDSPKDLISSAGWANEQLRHRSRYLRPTADQVRNSNRGNNRTRQRRRRQHLLPGSVCA